MGFHGRLIAALTLVATIVALVTSVMNASLLVRSQVTNALETSLLLAQSLALHAGRAVQDQPEADLRRALEASAPLENQIDALVGYSKTILYVAVADPEGAAVLHSNPAGRGAILEPLPSLEAFAERNALIQLVQLGRGEATFGVDLPIKADGQSVGVVRVAVSGLLFKKALLGTIVLQALIATAVVLLAFLGSMVLATGMLAPIERLRDELSQIDTGEGRPRLDLRNAADVQRISEFFATIGRSLAERRAGAGGEDQRTAGMLRMTSAVLHQIRNPLNALVFKVATLRQNVQREAQEQLDGLEREIRRADEVIQGFLRLTRPQELSPEPVAIEALVAGVAEQWSPRAAAGGVRVETAVDPRLPRLAGNRELLEEALGNLVSNALDAARDGGRVMVAAAPAPGGGVALSVRDSGPGIPADVLPKVLELYFTTKQDGTGIGLALVKRIAELHGGDVRIDSREGRGTTVTIVLPEAVA